MAEVYGEKPKKFTREWWKWYWMYYKWHTIIAILAIIAIIMGINQKLNEVKYDLVLTYMSQTMRIGENGEAELTNALLPLMEDANEDSEVHLYINQINISENDIQMGTAVDLRTKHDMEFGDSLLYLYIYDTAEFDILENFYNLAETYLPVSEWGEVPEGAEVRIGADGVAYGVSLKDSKIMADCGIDADDLYVFVKNDNIDEEKNEIAEANAKALANELIK